MLGGRALLSRLEGSPLEGPSPQAWVGRVETLANTVCSRKKKENLKKNTPEGTLARGQTTSRRVKECVGCSLFKAEAAAGPHE